MLKILIKIKQIYDDRFLGNSRFVSSLYLNIHYTESVTISNHERCTAAFDMFLFLLLLQIVMSTLREETEESLQTNEAFDDDVVIDEPFRGMNDPDWDLWEEWMGWEGAGIRDYSSHINPYI